MGEKVCSLFYLATLIYSVAKYVTTEDEMALLFGLWASLMLEVRKRHDITIQMFTKKENEDDDDRHGAQ